jgi:hypothetical protein
MLLLLPARETVMMMMVMLMLAPRQAENRGELCNTPTATG